jgi:flagellar hook-length control protein FliK
MTEGGSNLSRATVETLSAMAVQVNRKLSEGNTKFAVELHPADLGKVEVTLTIARDGTTTAHLKFDTPVTAASFQAQEGQLRHQLAQTGLSLDSGSLTFSSRDDGNGGSFSQAFAQSQQQDQSSQNRQSQSQARAFQNAAAVAADADTSAASAVDAGLLALRAGASSTLALNLIV